MVYPRTVTNGAFFGVPLSYRNWAAILDTNIALYRSGRYGVLERKLGIVPFRAANHARDRLSGNVSLPGDGIAAIDRRRVRCGSNRQLNETARGDRDNVRAGHAEEFCRSRAYKRGTLHFRFAISSTAAVRRRSKMSMRRSTLLVRFSRKSMAGWRAVGRSPSSDRRNMRSCAASPRSWGRSFGRPIAGSRCRACARCRLAAMRSASCWSGAR